MASERENVARALWEHFLTCLPEFEKLGAIYMDAIYRMTDAAIAAMDSSHPAPETSRKLKDAAVNLVNWLDTHRPSPGPDDGLRSELCAAIVGSKTNEARAPDMSNWTYEELREEVVEQGRLAAQLQRELVALRAVLGDVEAMAWIIWPNDIINGWHLMKTRAAIAALDKARGDGWLPMESAPRDGSRILAWFSYGPEVVNWKYGWWHHKLDRECHEPTHWRPLPAPPAREVSDER